MQTSTNQDTYSSYYNKKFPTSIQENFQAEAAALWQELEQGLVEACRPSSPDYDLLITLIPKLEVFLTVYGPSKKRKEMLATLFIKLLLEEKTTNINKVIIIRIILVVIGGGNLENLRVNWKALYDFLEEASSDPFAALTGGGRNPKGKFVQEVVSLMRKVRVLYPEESIAEVLQRLRQNFSPSMTSGYKGSILLNLFFNAGVSGRDNKDPLGREYYEKQVIPELMAFWNGRRYQSETAYLTVLSRIAKKYPQIDWTPYYGQLFSYFFNAIKAEFPQKDGQGRGHSHRGPGIVGLSKKSGIWFVPDLLVKIMVPRTAKGGQEYWENLERIYRSTLPFIHPENGGAWSPTLMEFYSEFCKLFIRRSKREKRQAARKESREGKMEEEKEVIIEEGEDGAPLDEVDIGLLGGEEEEGDEAKEDEEEAAQRDEEEEEDRDEFISEAEKKEGRTDYLLDEECHTRVLDMMKYVIKNFVYSRDGKVIDHLAKTCRRLIFFRPAEFGPMVLKMLFSFFERSDLSHIGFIKILMICAYPLFSRNNYSQGLAELPKLLELTLEHLTSHDLPKTALLLEFYEVVFSLVPLYHQEDLKETFQKLHGNADAKTIKQQLNQNEEGDFWQVTEDLSDWAIKFFKKFVDLLKHFEKKDGHHFPRSTALVLNYRNLHSLIFQSSPRLIQRYIDTIKSYLEGNLQKPPSQYLPDILQPLNLRDAQSTLSNLIPVFKQQLLTKLSHPKSDAHINRPLYGLIKKSSVSSTFDEYELKITNKETLVRILIVFQDLLRFSSPALLNHREDIELIIFHTLLHEDHGVFDKASQLLHTIFLSLLSIYPTNLGSLNPSDLTKDEFIKLYKKVGQLPKRNLQIEWHSPNESELKYAQELFAVFFDNNLQEIEGLYLKGIDVRKTDLDNLTTLLDDLHLKKTELSNAERESIGRILVLVNYAFLGVSQRASYEGVAILSEEQKRFEERFALGFCRNARQKLCDIGNRLVQYTFSNLYIRDPTIGRALAQLIGTLYGEEEQHEELQRRMKTLKQKKRAFELEGARGEMYENRYLMAIHVNVKLQERILGHGANFEYNHNAHEMLFILWLFSFHPNEEVARLAMKIFRRRTLHLRPERKNELFAKISEYTVKFVNQRFSFLRDNAKDLEENKTIKFNNYEIIYNNKDTYVEILLKGVLYNLECLLPYLTVNMKHLFQFIQTLLDVPKTDDASFLLRFSRLINGLDFSPYSSADEAKKDDSQEKPILKSNDLYERFEQATSKHSGPKKVFYDKSQLTPHVEDQIRKATFVLNQEEGHWKYQVVAAFTGALLSRFLPSKSELLSQFISAVFRQLISGHYYLRFFAISAFPALLKLHTEDYRKDNEVKRKPEDFKNLKLSLDDAFKYHFLLKQDYDAHYIKDPFVGTLDIYEELEIDDVKEKPKTQLPNDLIATIQEKEFLRKLIMNLVTDVPSQEEANAQRGQGGIAALLGQIAFNFKHFIGDFFKHGSGSGKNKSVQNYSSLFSLAEASLLRSLLKYFDGPKVFNNSIELIEEFARDYNSREKQVVAAYYFYAVFRTLKFWDQSSADKATTKLCEILTNVLDNVSAENHMIWSVAFANATARVDYRILRGFLGKLLQNPFDKKLSNIQGRYLSIYETAIERNGVFSEEIAERFLDIILNFKPTETRQVEHIAQIITTLLKSYVLNPVNYHKLKNEGIVQNIDATLQQQPHDYVLESDYFLYRFNRKFDHILQNYAQWAKETPNPEENKIYLELLFILTRAFYSKKLTYSLYTYYEKSIIFLLELNSDDNLSLSLNAIQAHKDSITSVSKLLYPPQAIPTIVGTIEKCLKAKNPKVRENALKFYHYFYYNHIFQLKDKTIELVGNSLLDENPAVKNEAFEIIVDQFRLYTEKELREVIEKAKKLVEENKPKKSIESISKGLYILMGVVLSRPFEIEEWTDSVIEFLLAMKKYSKAANEKFNKEFAVKFWDSHKGRANVNERALSYEVYSDLREIGNPSSYFA